MKFNWGTGITFFIIAFMVFILFMVFKASNTKSDLYAEDYYKQEINYQKKINALHNAKHLKGQLSIIQSTEQIVISYPIDFKENKLIGKVHFFRPDNASLDKIFEIKVKENQQFLSKKDLVKGWYNVKIYWKSGGMDYFTEKRMKLN